MSIVRIVPIKKYAGSLLYNPCNYSHSRFNNNFNRDNRGIDIIIHDVDPFYFTFPIYFCIFKAILTIISNGKRGTPKTLMSWLLRVNDLYFIYILIFRVEISVDNCIF
ncbi:hypothetical protein AXF13_04635 [Desulfovibrio fairfieldensis]|uniref:Uncharacterized protein n=1 Tax=Desulfovibrio fairfieldensis TaxID=44742 RepID=A0A0X8JIJ0_9BACT|nr:hypothetical protein AXF13_04635 [Desulfovibrio fairfieldensis]